MKTPTKTQELYARYTALLQEHLSEVRDMGHSEFPPGTKVRWVRTFARDGQGLYLSGVIQPVDKWARSAQVKSASGALHSVPWYSLEFDVEVAQADIPIETVKAV